MKNTIVLKNASMHSTGRGQYLIVLDFMFNGQEIIKRFHSTNSIIFDEWTDLDSHTDSDAMNMLFHLVGEETVYDSIDSELYID